MSHVHTQMCFSTFFVMLPVNDGKRHDGFNLEDNDCTFCLNAKTNTHTQQARHTRLGLKQSTYVTLTEHERDPRKQPITKRKKKD